MSMREHGPTTKNNFIKKIFSAPWKKRETRENRTRRIESFFSLLAITNNCASWLNLRLEIAVVKFPIDFIGFGVLEISDEERE